MHVKTHLNQRIVSFIFTLTIIAATTTQVALSANQLPSCAIMPVGGDGQMSETELFTVREEKFRAVKDSGRLAPRHNSDVDRALVQRRFNAAAFDRPEVAAAEAGRLLGVDYVIYSQMYYSDGRWLLDTGLLDVKGLRVVRFMRGRYTGTEQQVSSQGSRINIEHILDAKESETAETPAREIAPSPPTPSPPSAQQRMASPPAAAKTPAPAPRPRIELAQPQEPADPNARRLDIGIRLPRSAPPVLISWMLLPYLGIELNYNYDLQIDVDQNDVKAGSFKAQSIGTSLFLRYSNQITLVGRHIPLRFQVGAGPAMLVDSGFDSKKWWRNGFSSDNRQAYRDWVAAGSPANPNDGLKRSASPSNSLALNLDLTTSIGITQSLFFDVYLQYLYSKIDADFDNIRHGSLESTREGSIKISDFSTGIGLRYSF